jgi:branched-chain amino acid transport system permease protein
VRWSEPGSRTLGISVVPMKIIVAGLGALVAGIGGGLLVTAQTTAQPANFATFLGVVWLAVLVTIGVRSNVAALVAGLSFTLVPALFQAYLPSWTAQIPPVLFGLGAIGVAKFPDGTLAQNGQVLRRWLLHLANRGATPDIPTARGDGVLATASGASGSGGPAPVVEEVSR